MSNGNALKSPLLTAYWTGYQKFTDSGDNPFNPSETSVPDYVKDIDVIALAFLLVQKGTVQDNCDAATQTCLCMDNKTYWSLKDTKTWVQNTLDASPDTRFILSIGGWAFCDWASVKSADDFAQNVHDYIKNNWAKDEKDLSKGYLVSGIDLDYELGSDSNTALSDKIDFSDLIKSLSTKLKPLLGDDLIISLPLYSGSPAITQNALFPGNSSGEPDKSKGLQDVVSFVCTMDYDLNMSDFNQLNDWGYTGVMGFSYSPTGDLQDSDLWENPESNPLRTPAGVAKAITKNKIKNAMYWTLSMLSNPKDTAPGEFIKAMKTAIDS